MDITRRQSLNWRQKVVRYGCVMCRQYPPTHALRVAYRTELGVIQGHHIIPKRTLKQEHFTDHVWDHRNGLGLCAWHHQRHENHRQRVPRDLLPEAVYEFAAELGIMWMLDREYPEETFDG